MAMARKRAGKKSAGKPSDGHRDGGGRFLPGNPGGPGRPRGSRNLAAELVEDLLAGDVEALTQSLIRRAKSGHGSALQIAFGILCPVRRDRPIAVKLPAVGSMCEVVAAHDMLLRQVADGELAPAAAQAVAGLLELRRKATETAQLEERLSALEARLPADP